MILHRDASFFVVYVQIQTFGFATEEFQVTTERLGVYLPTVRPISLFTYFPSLRSMSIYVGTH
jgi:hypothetical protein